jgi:hypothetical protein
VVEATYTSGNWWPLEREDKDFWHWSRGDSTVTIHNPQPFPVRADIRFGMATGDLRQAIVSIGARVAWSGAVKPARENAAKISGLTLEPGDTVLLFQSDHPAASPGPGDPRLITYSVRDLTIDLKEGR